MSQIPDAIYIGTVERGKFIPDDREGFKRAFWGHEGRKVALTVKRYRRRRTNPQNAYYWGVVVPMVGQAIGESDAEAVHGLLKNHFNYTIRQIAGRPVRVPQSTADLTTDEFMDYAAKIQRWAAEFLHLYIPDPDGVVLA